MDAEARHGVAKVNDSLEMRFRRRMGAGGEGQKNFWRWNSGEGWVLAAKEKNFLEKEFQRRMGAEAQCGCGEGKKFFGDGISAKDGCWRRR